MADSNNIHNNTDSNNMSSINQNELINKKEEESEVKITDVGVDQDEENETITMLDVLQEEQELEDNAFAVLAASDDKNCTYLQGYVDRQALYACNTCRISDGENAGICLACSYTCHDGHDLFELYTKRNFRCDCGNDKFVDNKCKLYPKTSVNDQNEYNHNFSGTYCTCKRPYPDPDNDVEDQMIQCVACEDWYHGRHLGLYPENGDFAEMICCSCMTRLPFLWNYYWAYGQKINVENAETNEDLDRTCSNSDEKSDIKPVESAESEPIVLSESDSRIENSRDTGLSTDVSATPSTQCKLSVLKSSSTEPHPKDLMPTYWPLTWRSNLCKCSHCMSLYTANKCLFLINNKDMVHYYESQGIQSNTKVSHYDKGISELNKMNRVQQIEYISSYNDLKNQLKDYLKKFAHSNKVVTEQDIKQFFEQINSRKRQRVDIQYNCK